MTNFLALFDLIGELSRRRYQAAERCFATVGLNHTEARLLSVLSKEGGAAAQDVLSGRLHVDRSNGVRALQRLEREGYIVKHKDEEDKRANLVRMTPKGRKAVAEISRIRKEMVATFFGGLTDEEAGAAVALLSKVGPEP